MRTTFLALAFSVTALLGTTALADARTDSFKPKSGGHGGKQNHQIFRPARPDSHHYDKHPMQLRGSFAHKKDDHRRRGKDDHRWARKFEHEKHPRYRAPDHGRRDAFPDFFRGPGSSVRSWIKNLWWGDRWDRDDHGKSSHKTHGGYSPPPHHGKPDYDKPDWDKPHNHDRPDKPGWHTPKPDCPDPYIPIPEPSSLPILASGLLMAAWMFRRGGKRRFWPN
jgi:hypothetical protein